jgi:porin-like protein/outer membrane DcaP-like protein
MKNGRQIAITAATTCALSAALTIAPFTARSDELSDLQQKNELLQQRLDQLAQAIPGAGGFYTQGAPPAPTAGAGLVGGSFPRSFLIPGTDTSLRVGGEVRENLLYFFNGGNPNTSGGTSNVLNNGALNSTPYNFHNTVVGGVVVPTSNSVRSRSSSIFYQTPEQTKLSTETRTPTAFGEVRTFVEFDFGSQNNFLPGGTNPLTSTNSLRQRLRYAYGTLGGFLAGQANSNFSDPDADPPQLEFGGQVGNPGVTRIPQVRYTVPLQSYGFLGALSFSAEAPETDAVISGTQIDSDTGANATTAITASTTTCTSTAVTALGTTPTITCNIGGNLPTFNPTKSPAPDLTAAWYIPQPWGHLDMSLVFRPTLQFKDGLFVDKTMVGYGGHIGGDVKPGWFGWAKDGFTFHMLGGENIGRYLGGNSTMFSIVSNYPATQVTTLAGAQAVQVKSSFAFGANASYTHWWTDNIRSYVGGGIQHHDIPVNLRTVTATGSTGVSPICSGGISAAALTGAGGCGLNKELVSANVGTIWSPVAFVDFGLEYSYGHRQAVSNVKGDVSALTSRFTFRF